MGHKAWIFLAFLLGACNQASCGYQPSVPVSDPAWNNAWTIQTTDIYGPYAHFEICKFESENFHCLYLPWP